MKFFDAFWKPAFYQDNKHRLSFWKGYGRLLLVCFIMSIVVASVVYVQLGRNIGSYYAKLVTEAKNGYPDDLVVKVNKDGVLLKNIPGSLKLYPIKDIVSIFSQDGTSIVETKNSPHFLFDIDESIDTSLASYMASDAIILLAHDGFVSPSKNEIRISAYSTLGTATNGKNDFSFTKETLVTFSTLAEKYVRMAPTVITATIIITGTLFLPLLYLLGILFTALVVMLLSIHILKYKSTYKESYMLVLYAFPTSIIIIKVLSIIPYIAPVITKIPFSSTLTVVLFLWCMMSTRKETKGGAVTHTQLP